MPNDESFAPEPEAPPVVADVVPEPAAPEAPEAIAPEPAAPEPVQEPVAPEPVAEVPAFDEAKYLKDLYGDDAPETVDAAKERLAGLKAKQLTPEIEAQLAILRDPAKMAEYASIAGKDYDKPSAREIMRERFAQQHPEMEADLLDFRFDQEFSRKYPTLAAAIANQDDYNADDPALVLETKAADYDAKADRAALKAAQQEATQKFVSATAAPQPQLTPAQQADAQTLPAWLDEAAKDGATLPIDLGEGLSIDFPVGKSADFKADFYKTGDLLAAQTFNKDGLINRESNALLTRILQMGPKAFAQEVARQALAQQQAKAPATPSMADLTNASTRRPPAQPAPALRSAQPASFQADSWLNNNA